VFVAELLPFFGHAVDHDQRAVRGEAADHGFTDCVAGREVGDAGHFLHRLHEALAAQAIEATPFNDTHSLGKIALVDGTKARDHDGIGLQVCDIERDRKHCILFAQVSGHDARGQAVFLYFDREYALRQVIKTESAGGIGMHVLPECGDNHTGAWDSFAVGVGDVAAEGGGMYAASGEQN
jgi:hypothetical protein